MTRSKQSGMKREREIKNQKRKKEKEERKLERKSNSNKGKGLDAMIAYVDENGHLSATPPDPLRKKEINAEDIDIGVRKDTDPATPKYMNEGRISYYNEEKGYGFIKDNRTNESVFFHSGDLQVPAKLYVLVSFQKVKGPRGISAAHIKVI